MGPSFPRAVSSPASSCLPTGLLGFPEGRTWAHSGPSLVSVDTGGLANGSKGEVPPRAGQGGRGRGGGLAKRAGTGLTPFRQAVLLTWTECAAPWHWREGTQQSSSPSPTPSGPLLTRCTGGVHRGPPRVSPSVGEFVVGGVLCPEVCGRGSGGQHWGPAPGLRGGEHRGQVPGLASGQGTS